MLLDFQFSDADPLGPIAARCFARFIWTIAHCRALARRSPRSSFEGSESDWDNDCASEKVSYGTDEELAESDS